MNKYLFVGTHLKKIDDDIKNPISNANDFKRLTLRISNISANTTKYLINETMARIKSNFWHIPVATNGIATML